MWILLLEALAALSLLVFFVWWTMYAGRKPDAPHEEDSPDRNHAKRRIE